MTTRKRIYLDNKEKKTGETCICPVCKTEFIKKQYSQAFCCKECRDKFHNDRKKGKRGDYYRMYNFEHPERLERIGLERLSDQEIAEYAHPCSEEAVQG